MAFFEEQGTLGRDLWPAEIAHCIQAVDGGQPLASWLRLPADYDGLCDRVCVDGAGTRSPQVLLSHPDLEAEGKIVTFMVRVQGVVENHNLGAVGNWTGDITHAPKALQTLVLGSGGCAPAFGVQKTGLGHLEEVILNSIGSSSHTGHLGRHGSLKLTRRVFTKVHADNNPPAIRLSSTEDPSGKAAKISSSWRVDHRVKVGIRGEDGRISARSAMAIRRGDFVDVAATVEVVTMHGKHGRRVEVHVCPQEVVRLKAAADANRLLRKPPTPVDSAPATQRRVVNTVTGFAFSATGGPSNDAQTGDEDSEDEDADMEDVQT